MSPSAKLTGEQSFEIGLESDPDHDNNWPDIFDEEGKQFKHHMLEFFGQCKEMHVQVMRAIAVGMALEERWFDKFTDGGDNTLRLLHYPEVKSEVFKQNKNQVRAGEHVRFLLVQLLTHTDAESFDLNPFMISSTRCERLLIVSQSDYGSITLVSRA